MSLPAPAPVRHIGTGLLPQGIRIAPLNAMFRRVEMAPGDTACGNAERVSVKVRAGLQTRGVSTGGCDCGVPPRPGGQDVTRPRRLHRRRAASLSEAAIRPTPTPRLPSTRRRGGQCGPEAGIRRGRPWQKASTSRDQLSLGPLATARDGNGVEYTKHTSREPVASHS